MAATLGIYTGIVTNSLGQAVPGATIIVLSGTIGGTDAVNLSTQPGSPLATIYVDPYAQTLIDQTTSPLLSDDNGNFSFCATSGWYVLQIYGLGVGAQYTQGISIFLGGSVGPQGTFSTATPTLNQPTVTTTITQSETSTSGTSTLQTLPTPGNTLLFTLQGYGESVTIIPPAGLTLLTNTSGGDLVGYAWSRQVEPGDGMDWKVNLSSSPGILYWTVSEIAGTPIIAAASGTATVNAIDSSLTSGVVNPQAPGFVFSCFCAEQAGSFAWTGFAPLPFYSGTSFASSGSATQQATIGFGAGSTVPNSAVTAYYNPSQQPENTPIYMTISCTIVPVGPPGPTGPTGPAGAVSGNGAFYYTIDGNGTTPTAGGYGEIYIPCACVITGWALIADQSGSAVLDVLHSTFGAFPTNSSLCGTDKPTLASVQKNENTAVSVWTTALSAGDVLQIAIDSATTVTRLCLTIMVTV